MSPYTGKIPTKCPYTFRDMDPEATHSPYVPNPEDFPLPEGWQGSGTITIAMAGARASGKSLYIAVVVKLLRQLAIANGGTFRPADEHTRQTYTEKYERPLFEQMGLLPSTPSAQSADAHQRRPLIFDVGTHPRADGAQKIFIVFRDVAGEDLREENFVEREQQLEFFRYADRIIFLFDPMAVPRIQHLLSGAVPRHEVGDDRPIAVLQNVLRVLGADYRPGIALVLSKFDTMQCLANVNESNSYYTGSVNWQRVMNNFGAGFRRENSRMEDPFDMENSQLLHFEVLSLLDCLGATELMNQLRQPLFGTDTYRFQCFAVSALGAPPDGGQVNRSGIAPFRCLDPLRELFARFSLMNGAQR
ncbi:hypothetical protein [Corynebacterium sp.]|uniref:TRAFAC clade GTPase domain-containing protein n=1 Tax=Corynebacterium sp. TaxID=1720 RepID=UPI0026DD12E1|nr:hypothetical protein [Corynebacterium sp.]MDO5076852.1 hypothetical protein [Corynebacterium sp.]